MKTRKGLTRELVEMRANGLPYSALAKVKGVTRQRVQQLFIPPKEVMVEVATRVEARCEECGQFDMFGYFHHKVYDYEIFNEPNNIIYLCTICHLRLRGDIKNCLNCGKEYKASSKKGDFCCISCKVAYNSIPCKCSNCGKDFVLTASQKRRITASKSGLLFCTKKCQGIYAGNHYGFAVHPENSTTRLGDSIYKDIIPTVNKRMSKGKSLHSTIKSMEIPIGSYRLIKRLVDIEAST